MKDNKLKFFLPTIIIIYCLIIIALYGYNLYLKKPGESDWSQVKKYLTTSGNYKDEPVVLSPAWLKPYASIVINKFQGLDLNVVKKNGDFNTYWLISMSKKNVPKNYRIITAMEFENLFVFKLKKTTPF